MKYRIYPTIGVARLGGSSEFFVGPEIPRHPGVDIDSQGNETTVASYKGADNRIKKQAARFRIFEFNDDGTGDGAPVELPADATIEWKVGLANKKSAVSRPGRPTWPESAWVPGTRPQILAGRANRHINPSPKTIEGADQNGVMFDDGACLNIPVPLGELRTDYSQNLMVLGADGVSKSVVTPAAELGDFYNNPDWFDDAADGTVEAKIKLPDGNEITDIVPAWVVIAPPDFAPPIKGVISLYDVLLQVGISHFGVQLPAQPSFTQHIFPLIQRASHLQWVQEDGNPANPGDEEWAKISTDWQELADDSATAQTLREDTAEGVELVPAVLGRVRLQAFQRNQLSQWEQGNFNSDWTGIPQPSNKITAQGLTRTALEACVGQGFYPGIEAGVIVTDRTLYDTSLPAFDFRISHANLTAGDLTALMAVPWQADFLDCQKTWWPTQRPDKGHQQSDPATFERWARGLANPYEEARKDMVDNFERLGFIVEKTIATATGDQIVYLEDERDPAMPNSPSFH